MSIGYTFVLADDLKFYEDPVFRGNDYFLCFDEDEDPELVIMELKKTPEQLKQRAIEILKDIGVQYSEIIDRDRKSGRCFKKKIKTAVSYFIKITAPIPAKKITEYKFILNGKECGTFIHFNNPKIFKEINS